MVPRPPLVHHGAMTREPRAAIRFDLHVLDLDRHELRRDGARIALQPKPFALLAYFCAHPGRMIGKDELLAALWPGVIVTENSLTRCVKDLRKALGDEVERPRYIETVPRLGYRFLAQPVAEPLAVAPASDVEVDRVDRHARPPAVRPALWPVALVLPLVAAMLLWRSWSDPARPSPANVVVAPAVVAVLPFTIDAGEGSGEDAALGAGLAEDLLDRLRRDPGLRVLARGTSFAFAGRDRSASDVGRALSVDWVLGGRVRRIGADLALEVRLHEVAGSGEDWSRDYRRAANLWPRLQAEIAADARERMLGQPGPAAAASAAPGSAGFDAHLAYLVGREHLERRRHGWREQALAAFERAIALDADNAPAHAGLAIVLAVRARGTDDPGRDLARAEAAIARALALDPRCASAHAAQGVLDLQRGRDREAEAALGRALALDPGQVWAYSWLSIALARQGRMDESLAQLERAIALDPINPRLLENYGAQLQARGEPDAAQRMYARMLQIPDPPPAAAIRLASLALGRGRLVEALEHAEAIERYADPARPASSLIPSAVVYARLGLCTQAQARLRAARAGPLESAWRPQLELAYRALGRNDELAALVGTSRNGKATLPALRRFLGQAAVLEGRFAAGLEHLTAVESASPTAEPSDTAAIDTTLVHTYAFQGVGKRDEARARLAGYFEAHARNAAQGLTNTPDEHYLHALALHLDGRRDDALAALDRAQALGWNDVYTAWYDRRWRDLREDPGFLQRLGQGCGSVAIERRKLAAQRSLVLPDPACPPPIDEPPCPVATTAG